MEIKRFVPKSLAKVSGFLYAIFGFIIGLFFLVISLFASSDDGPTGLMFGIGAPIVLPIIYGVGGFVGGYITAWIYNFCAKRVGGMEIETE